MKFDNMRKTRVHNTQTRYIPERSVMMCEDKKPCHICGKLTAYVDYCYELRLCSTECQDKMGEMLQHYEQNY